MKVEGRWRYLPLIVIAAVGISGVAEAWSHASESAGDLLIDAGILAGIIGVSVLLARLFRRRGPGTR